MKTGRNDPCPCGSGKKHKKCCLGKMSPAARRRLWLTLAGAFLVICGATAWVSWSSGFRDGLFTGIGGAVAIAIFLAVRNPAKSRGRRGADNINFGR